MSATAGTSASPRVTASARGDIPFMIVDSPIDVFVLLGDSNAEPLSI
jgi:hypothetical protein